MEKKEIEFEFERATKNTFRIEGTEEAESDGEMEIRGL